MRLHVVLSHVEGNVPRVHGTYSTMGQAFDVERDIVGQNGGNPRLVVVVQSVTLDAPPVNTGRYPT